MKIGQAIDEIMINEEKEFEGSVDGFCYRISCINGEIETMVINESIGAGVMKIILGLPYTRILKEVDWKLVERPVTFMEAVASGKDFRVEHEDCKLHPSLKYMEVEDFIYHLYDNCDGRNFKDIILEGKFYIKEDN